MGGLLKRKKIGDKFFAFLILQRTDRYIFIILEYCKGGDLQHFIKNQPNGRLSEASARHFMSDLGAGLKFLNDRNLVHRDIKVKKAGLI